ncbi:MAG: family 20 glycosylhydrolase [Bacteroidales bacterium]|nr:family 20 glycosylhydrolase [Bacteroidales bacterium]
MNRYQSGILSIAMLLAGPALSATQNTPYTTPGYSYHILPSVAEITYNAGTLDYNSLTLVTVKGDEPQAVKFASDLESRSIRAVSGKHSSKDILNVTLKPLPSHTDSNATDETYGITVGRKGVTVTASTEAGFYYAAQTLAQILRQAASEGGKLRECTITDSPRFGYRGMMVDVARCYIPVENLRKLIDQASALKINNVHLHLTDDNGWRLEIKKYPRLTEIGAWRVDRPDKFPTRLNARSADEPALYGGFYTQQQMKELVNYAAERNVNIIPEIELPAHAAAAIASYPELTCQVDNEFIGPFPGIGGKDASIIICGGNDDAITFYKGVLDEVMDIFPSKMIHLGGDEANKSRWEKCPRCKARIDSLGLDGYEALQGWFMNQIADHVMANGRTPMGWDEATYGNPTKEMTIMGWQGTGKVAVEDARHSGRKFIMTPAQKLYLIRYQGPQWFEPFTYFGNNTLTDIYNYEPVADDWTPEMENQLQGIQGSLWSEFCSSPSDMEYLLFPRMLAVAERAWSPAGRHQWGEFIASSDNMLKEMGDKGINYATSMYNIQHDAQPDNIGNVTVTLTNERPDMDIRYILSNRGSNSENTDVATGTIYTAPLTIAPGTTVYAATYDKQGRQHGRMLSLPVVNHKGVGHNVTAKSTNGRHAVLTNGVRGSSRNSDFEWAGWHNSDAEMTLDLGAPTAVNTVAVGTLVDPDLCVAAPAIIELYASNDGTDYTLIDTISYDPATYFRPGNNRLESTFNANLDSARYLRIRATNPGRIPDGMAREGTPTWIYFDEITVR